MEHNRAVMINLSPEECMRIATGEQEALLRKLKPNLSTPFKVYIFCSKSGTRVFGDDTSIMTDYLKLLKSEKDFERTSGKHKWNGKVIGEFICDDITKITDSVTHSYAWNGLELKFYDKPKAISDFCKPDYKHKCFGTWVWKQGSFLTQAPTNWCYVKDWFYTEKGGV